MHPTIFASPDFSASFLHPANNASLKRYFHEREILSEFDFDGMKGTKVFHLAGQCLKLPRRARLDTEVDFLDIQKMSSQIGMQAIKDIEREKKQDDSNIIQRLDNMETDLDRAFWYFLNCPDDWQKAINVLSREIVANTVGCEKVRKLPTELHRVNVEKIDKISKVIDHYLASLANKGKPCNAYVYQWISGNRFLCFFEQDDGTDCLALEVIISGNGPDSQEQHWFTKAFLGPDVLQDSYKPTANIGHPFMFTSINSIKDLNVIIRKIECGSDNSIDILHDTVHLMSRGTTGSFTRVFSLSIELNRNTPCLDMKLSDNNTDERTSRHAKQSLASAETRCGKWLARLPETPRQRKKDVKKVALDKFSGMSDRGFDRSWSAKAHSSWKQPGRPKSKHRTN